MTLNFYIFFFLFFTFRMAENNSTRDFPYAVRRSEEDCTCGNVSRLLACCHHITSLQVAVANHRGRHTGGCGVCCGFFAAQIKAYEEEKLALKGSCSHMRELLNYFLRHRWYRLYILYILNILNAIYFSIFRFQHLCTSGKCVVGGCYQNIKPLSGIW